MAKATLATAWAELDAVISAVKLKPKDIDGRIVRIISVELVHDLTADLARSLGKAARSNRDELKSLGVSKVVMPIDGLVAHGAFTAADETAVHIGSMKGTKAELTKPSKEDGVPQAKLCFEFFYDRDAWVFLGEHCNAVARVVITKKQGELDFDAPPPPSTSN